LYLLEIETPKYVVRLMSGLAITRTKSRAVIIIGGCLVPRSSVEKSGEGKNFLYLLEIETAISQ
jgi:hypothetical protein